MIETFACIGLLCVSISSVSHAQSDPVKARQDVLLKMLQYIQVPHIDGSRVAECEDQALGKLEQRGEEGKYRSGSANQKYITPRPWRSACVKYTACLLNGINIREATAWFKDEKNLVISEWETLMMLRAYNALKDSAYFIESGAKEEVGKYLHKCLEATRTPGNRVNWKLDGYWGSENHKIVQFSERLLLEEFAGQDMDKNIHSRVAECEEKEGKYGRGLQVLL